ncbi:MAG: hypothetical protein AB7K71_33485 [Polyangiaceae bacterium]
MTNPYEAPIDDDPPPSSVMGPELPPFYPVGTTKLWVMALATSGLYLIFWFERQWRYVHARTGQPMMPFWRGMFSIFFVHRLFREISAYGHGEGVEMLMNPNSSASMFVGLTLGSRFVQRIGDSTNSSGGAFLISMLMFAASVSPIAMAQKEINRILEHEYRGMDMNTRFTAWNMLVLLTVGSFFAFGIAAQLGLLGP